MPNSVNTNRNAQHRRPAHQTNSRTSSRNTHAQRHAQQRRRSSRPSGQTSRAHQQARQQARGGQARQQRPAAPRTGNARPNTAAHRTAPAAQRASVSTAVRRQHAKERQKAYGPSSKSRIIVAVILVAVFAAIGVAVAVNQSGESKYASCEKWRSTMVAACKACDLDVDWTNALLAAMYVESGGDTGVKSVTGAKGDIMQAAEGAYGYILTDGSKEYGVRANTPEASIYAGVLEFKQNLETWDSYLGGIGPTDADKIQLVVQGYNFGADGWFKWCEERGITEYTVEAATQYSNEEMPEDAKGTPTHGQKWLTAFKRITADYSS